MDNRGLGRWAAPGSACSPPNCKPPLCTSSWMRVRRGGGSGSGQAEDIAGLGYWRMRTEGAGIAWGEAGCCLEVPVPDYPLPDHLLSLPSPRLAVLSCDLQFGSKQEILELPTTPCFAALAAPYTPRSLAAASAASRLLHARPTTSDHCRPPLIIAVMQRI